MAEPSRLSVTPSTPAATMWTSTTPPRINGATTASSAHKPTAARTSRVLHHTEEYLRHLANEPTVGQYYVREHVHKSVKQLTEAEGMVRAATRGASEGRIDAKGALEAVAAMNTHGEEHLKKKKKKKCCALPTLPVYVKLLYVVFFFFFTLSLSL